MSKRVRQGIAFSPLAAVVGVFAVLVLLPIAVVLLASFTPLEFIEFPPSGVSFRWYAEVLADPDWAASLRLSGEIAAGVTMLALMLGVPAALGLRQLRGWAGIALQTFFLSPLMVPTMVIGLALLRLFSAMGIPLSPATIVLGQTLIATPYVIRLVLASLAGLDPALERAASILGASGWMIFRRITLPLIRQGVVAGALFCMIVSLDDVNVALFLSSVRASPLSVRLFSYILQNADPLGTAVSSILVLIALALIFLCDWLVGISWVLGIDTRRRVRG
jgi:putative spermidine/putrescine transport system permease protein